MSWKERVAHSTKYIRYNLILIGESIWYSTDYNEGVKGMGEYCIKTNKIISKVPYPNDIKPGYHSCCSYNNQIYIVDGENGQIILFNPFTKQFKKQAEIPKLGSHTSCICINGNIHILCGTNNNDKHIIYCINTHKIKTIIDKTINQKIWNVCVLNYDDKIIRLGEYDDGKKYLDTLFLSSIIGQNYDNIK